MVIAVDNEDNVYVLDYVRDRGAPTVGQKNSSGDIQGKTGVVDYLIQKYKQYNCISATVEDVAMNRSIFNALNIERSRLREYDISVIPSKPGGREKRNKSDRNENS